LITILGRSRKEKGDLFEEFMQKVLNQVGYCDFRRSSRRTGREMDIRAWHKVTRQPIICECKAREDKIGSSEINKFYGIYHQEYQRENTLIGLLFSLSGFKSTALDLYEEMDTEVRKRFKLFDGNNILEILRSAGIVASDDKLGHVLRMRLKHPLDDRFLAHTRSGTYWVQLLKTEGKVTHFAVVDGQGQDVPKYICDELANLEPKLSGLEHLDLQVRSKTLRYLLDGQDKIIEQISDDVGESKDSVRLALEDLIAEGKVRLDEKTGRYSIPRDLRVFLSLAEEFLGNEEEVSFFLSMYCKEMMDMNLVNLIEQRFRLELELDQRRTLLRLISLTPSGLRESLFGSTEVFQTLHEHIQQLAIRGEDYKKLKNLALSQFLATLLRKLIEDSGKPHSKEILQDREIRGYRTLLSVNFATRKEAFLSAEAGGTVMIFPAKGKISAGQLVSPTSFDLCIEEGLILANLEDHYEAIKCYDMAIERLDDGNKLKVAWNNKGLSMVHLGRFDEAIACYDKALEIDDRLKEAWYNKGRAYTFKQEDRNAIKCYEKALEIDPEYENARRAKNETLTKLRNLNEKTS